MRSLFVLGACTAVLVACSSRHAVREPAPNPRSHSATDVDVAFQPASGVREVPKRASPPAPAASEESNPAPCPPELSGLGPRAGIATERVEGGIALIFTTSDDVVAFRNRIETLGRDFERRPRVDKIDRGMRLVFEVAPSEVADVRREIEELALDLAKRCVLVQGDAGEEPAEAPSLIEQQPAAEEEPGPEEQSEQDDP